MEERICKNCSHWTRTITKACVSDFRDPVRVIEEVIKTYGLCDCDKFVESKNPPIDGLEYWDYEGYSAGFKTGEAFGCVHFTTGGREDDRL